MENYQIIYTSKKTWQVYHVEFGLCGEFKTFDDAERFINFN
jgi:hypothetical protein